MAGKMNPEIELKKFITEYLSQYNIKYYAVQRSMYFAGVEVRLYNDTITWYVESHFPVIDFFNNKDNLRKELQELHKLYLIGPPKND